MSKNSDHITVTLKLDRNHLALLKKSSKLKEMSDPFFLEFIVSDDDELIVTGISDYVNNFQTRLADTERDIKAVVIATETKELLNNKNVLDDLEKAVMDETKEYVILYVNNIGDLCAYIMKENALQKIIKFINSYIVKTKFYLDEQKLRLIADESWESYFLNLKHYYGEALAWSSMGTNLTIVGFLKYEENLKQMMERFWDGNIPVFKYHTISTDVAQFIDQFAQVQLHGIINSAIKNDIDIKLMAKPYNKDSDFILMGNCQYMDFYIEKLRDICKEVVQETRIITASAKRVLQDELLMCDITNKNKVNIKNLKEITGPLNSNQYVMASSNFGFCDLSTSNDYIQMDIYSLNADNISSAVSDIFRSLLMIARTKEY